MNHSKSEKKPKRKCLSDLVSPYLLVCFVLAATCAALVVVILQMDRRISAFNDTLEELRREGKQASTVNNSATVSSALGTRAKRAISKTTPGQKSDIEKRLKAVEERRVK